MQSEHQVEYHDRTQHFGLPKPLKTYVKGALKSGLATAASVATSFATGNPLAGAAAGVAARAGLDTAMGGDDDPDFVPTTLPTQQGNVFEQAAVDHDMQDNANDTLGTRRFKGKRPNLKNGGKPPPHIFEMKKAATKKTTKRGTRKPRMIMTRGPTFASEVKHHDKQISMPWGTQAVGDEARWVGPTGNGMSCLPLQGTDDTNRIGRRITVIGMSYKCRLIANAAAIPLQGDAVKMQFWLDNACKGNQPTPAMVYDAFPTGSLTTVFSPILQENKQRFTKLAEWVHEVAVAQSTGTVVQSVNYVDVAEGFVKLNVVTNYSANTGNISDLLDNNFFMLGCNSQKAFSVLQPYIMDMGIRYYFVDA